MAFVTPSLWRPQGVKDLESGAWEALRENDRNVCLTAGAGAGKTEFLAQKATYLLQTGLCQAPKRIVAISFKRDAARNLAERVGERCPPAQAQRFDSYSFDAFTKGLLDRFRAAIPAPYTPPADYRIDFPNRYQMENFLIAHGFHGLNAQQFERVIALTKFPLDEKTDGAVRAYWTTQFNNYDQVLLSFSMINRLVHWLLRVNPGIRKALQITYPFIFLDEFQDTTTAQYELLRTAFDGSSAVLTVVGDCKQRIMGWAGALPNALNHFSEESDARCLALVSNWRSHRDLVLIQHAIGRQIDPQSEQPEAQAQRDVDGDVAAIWHYASDQEESAGLASWISREITVGLAPHEIAILVRMRPNDLAATLNDPLSKAGVRMRNLARNVGDISIQDLLSEELSEILLPLLRLGATTKDPQAWGKSHQNLQFLEAVDHDDEQGQQHLHDRLQRFVRELRSWMTSSVPDAQSAQLMAQRASDFVDVAILRRAFPAYQRDTDFLRVWGGFVELLIESADGAGSWSEVLDRFEGIGEIALMTIHKSKGLEFHTIIFCGLDNTSWWSLTPNEEEEVSSFFVAFTRAKQRAFFTLSAQRGGPVAWLENLLAPAGLNRIPGPT